jgi:ornithine cyclodeaminase
MLLLDLVTVKELLQRVGLEVFFELLVQQLKTDFSNWHDFIKTPRQCTYFQDGAIELMPIATSQTYSNKIVSTYPNNAAKQHFTVIGHGMLLDSQTGEMQLFCEMTVLTAIRTAAVSVLASLLMARSDTKKIAIIGCGSQSEFQVLAHHFYYPDCKWSCYDINPKAMARLQAHVKPYGIEVGLCQTAKEAVLDADIVITLTSAIRSYPVVELSHLKPNVHINALGGDAPGQSELPISILQQASQIVVEFFPQTLHEGEIQQDLSIAHSSKVIELWEVVTGAKIARHHDSDMTVFDGVGFALSDFSCLKLMIKLAKTHQLGRVCDLLPIYDPEKGLFGQLI